MWKSTSSNGWEYFIMWEDLGSSPMYVNYVLFICYYTFIYVIMLWNDIIHELN